MTATQRPWWRRLFGYQREVYMGVYELQTAHVLYLLAACTFADDSTEHQVNAAEVRKETHERIARGEERVAQMILARRGYITTRGAGKPPVGFFWITDKGLEVAKEARKNGWSWPPEL